MMSENGRCCLLSTSSFFFLDEDKVSLILHVNTPVFCYKHTSDYLCSSKPFIVVNLCVCAAVVDTFVSMREKSKITKRRAREREREEQADDCFFFFVSSTHSAGKGNEMAEGLEYW